MTNTSATLEMVAGRAATRHPEIKAAITAMSNAIAEYHAAYSSMETIPLKALICMGRIQDAHMLLLASIADSDDMLMGGN